MRRTFGPLMFAAMIAAALPVSAQDEKKFDDARPSCRIRTAVILGRL
jgi:hypothetical protein